MRGLRPQYPILWLISLLGKICTKLAHRTSPSSISRCAVVSRWRDTGNSSILYMSVIRNRWFGILVRHVNIGRGWLGSQILTLRSRICDNRMLVIQPLHHDFPRWLWHWPRWSCHWHTQFYLYLHWASSRFLFLSLDWKEKWRIVWRTWWRWWLRRKLNALQWQSTALTRELSLDLRGRQYPAFIVVFDPLSTFPWKSASGNDLIR